MSLVPPKADENGNHTLVALTPEYEVIGHYWGVPHSPYFVPGSIGEFAKRAQQDYPRTRWHEASVYRGTPYGVERWLADNHLFRVKSMCMVGETCGKYNTDIRWILRYRATPPTGVYHLEQFKFSVGQGRSLVVMSQPDDRPPSGELTVYNQFPRMHDVGWKDSETVTCTKRAEFGRRVDDLMTRVTSSPEVSLWHLVISPTEPGQEWLDLRRFTLTLSALSLMLTGVVCCDWGAAEGMEAQRVASIPPASAVFEIAETPSLGNTEKTCSAETNWGVVHEIPDFYGQQNTVNIIWPQFDVIQRRFNATDVTGITPECARRMALSVRVGEKRLSPKLFVLQPAPPYYPGCNLRGSTDGITWARVTI